MPKSGPGTIRYGGNTSCVEVRTSRDTLVMIDCGSGAHALGQDILKRPDMPKRGHILISHTHWDHIQGFPFFAPLFIPGMEWDIYGPRGVGKSLQEALAGQMQYTYFPVSLDNMMATIRFHDLVEGQFEIDDVTVHTRYLNHPALTLAYRLEADGSSVSYACDHEPHSHDLAVGEGSVCGPDMAHAEFLAYSDLVIHDAQYTPDEYRKKVGWGHSTPGYAARICTHAGVGQLALTHHDPVSVDEDIDGMLATCRKNDLKPSDKLKVIAAGDQLAVELPRRLKRKTPSREQRSALAPAQTPAAGSVMLLVHDPDRLHVFEQALKAEDLPTAVPADRQELEEKIRSEKPALVVISEDAFAEGWRDLDDWLGSVAEDIPVLLLGDASQLTTDLPENAEWLIAPFTNEYLRTRLQSAILRASNRDMPKAKQGWTRKFLSRSS